jgi:hypothetical protein
MRAIRALLAILTAGLAAGACQAPMATLERTMAGDPAKPYLGMSKDEIIACAGTPASSYPNASGETLVYHYTGVGPVPLTDKTKAKTDPANPLAKSKSDKSWKCGASLVFEGGRLTHVTFAPNGVVSPYAEKKDKSGVEKPVPQPEPCTFALPNCGKP